jgi:riboflavin kinase/FMN adenylyltransferase
MKIYRTLESIEETRPCALALGAFDGLHRGHMAVIGKAVQAEGLEPAVFTFERSPSGREFVITARDKEKFLEQAGVSRLYSLRFPDVKDWEAEAFAKEVLLGRCQAKCLCCGEDFRFGKDAAGDVSLLEKLCKEAGVQLQVVPPVMDHGEKVSSTRIRQAVEEGKIPEANRLLGRPFGYSLEVIHGNHIGTGLGTPTINQALPEGFALPPFGVYASWVRVSGKYYYGVTNIGVKPTVGSDRVLSETWIPEFSGDLYGKRVRIFLLQFIRPERKFSSLEELKREIFQNSLQAKAAAEAAPPPGFGITL